MTWNDEKPTVPGWYWWRQHQGAPHFPARIIDQGGELIFLARVKLSHVEGQFAGPIPEPTEPSKLIRVLIDGQQVTFEDDGSHTAPEGGVDPGEVDNPK